MKNQLKAATLKEVRLATQVMLPVLRSNGISIPALIEVVARLYQDSLPSHWLAEEERHMIQDLRTFNLKYFPHLFEEEEP